MSDIEELIGRYLVLSQKSDSTLNIFFSSESWTSTATSFKNSK